MAAPPLRTNVRELLVRHQREELIRQLLVACGVNPPKKIRVTLAVSAALAWSKAVVDLLTTRRALDVPLPVDENPILFRQTELVLLRLGHRPLSPVRDIVGSQSSKAMHFVRQAGFSDARSGVWRVVSPSTGSRYEAIETIPTVLKRSRTFESAFKPLPKHPTFAPFIEQADKSAKTDVLRALRCALCASMYALAPEKLVGPVEGAPDQEGWIWYPADAEPAAKKKR